MTSPTRQIIRSALRATAKLFRRSGIEAGGGGRRWHGASVVTSPLQSTLAARGVSQARASGAYLNSPHANSAVEAHVSGLVGKGWHAPLKAPRHLDCPRPE